MLRSLPKVVEVIKDKCVNCHACIAACPVKYCNDASGDTVEIKTDMCIGCGQCLEACKHEARRPVDDTADFFDALNRHEPVIAVVAPAVAVSFPQEYLRLNGWLKSVGVAAVFDVSFGAELTVKSYFEHIKTNSPDLVIARPCPARVQPFHGLAASWLLSLLGLGCIQVVVRAHPFAAHDLDAVVGIQHVIALVNAVIVLGFDCCADAFTLSFNRLLNLRIHPLRCWLGGGKGSAGLPCSPSEIVRSPAWFDSQPG